MHLRILLLLSLVFLKIMTINLFARGYADNDTLDANQHVIMFEKGVDAFMLGEYDKCDDYWLPLARAGDYMAARNIALLYHQGKGVRKDLEEAEIFYRLAADNGVTSAQTVLGTMLIKGDEFERNIPEAIQYLTAAHKAGDPIAAWNLGLIYEHGIEVEKNLEKAMSLFRFAARAGHEPALVKVSGKAEDSFAVPIALKKNTEIILKQDKEFNVRPEQEAKPKTHQEKIELDKAHDKQHYSDHIHFNKKLQSDEQPIALKNDKGLYDMKQVGIAKEINPLGVEKSNLNRQHEPLDIEDLGDSPLSLQADKAYNLGNYNEAKKIWHILFDKSLNDEAAYRLGMLYFQGKGVKKSLERAYFYWKKGAEASGKKSVYALENFQKKLTDKGILYYEQQIISQKFLNNAF